MDECLLTGKIASDLGFLTLLGKSALAQTIHSIKMPHRALIFSESFRSIITDLLVPHLPR